MKFACAASALVLSLATAGCGSAVQEAPVVAAPVAPVVVTPPTVAPDDGVQVEGILGTISQQSINQGTDSRSDQFLRCYWEGLQRVPMLQGRVTLSFHVKMDGSVLWAFVSDSTLGDSETESCMARVGASAHFGRPRSGEAEFTSPFQFDPPDGTRAATALTETRLDGAFMMQVRGALHRCSTSPDDKVFSVTGYAQTPGQPLALSVTTQHREDVPAAECLQTAIRELHSWPDPGSYPGKFSFTLHSSAHQAHSR